jgi:hypothetical protein
VRVLALRRALRRKAGLVFLLVFWVLAGACQRHGVRGFLLRSKNMPIPVARPSYTTLQV